jgi:hypothetical protein
MQKIQKEVLPTVDDVRQEAAPLDFAPADCRRGGRPTDQCLQLAFVRSFRKRFTIVDFLLSSLPLPTPESAFDRSLGETWLPARSPRPAPEG